jgi:hypothetical protein|tara:strand:- start:227 stop:817 length:591 start_codon:yes stop_codon:yes gene_type:complete
MNNFCKKLNLSPKFTPNIDFTQWDTKGLNWVQFHKVLEPKELNNDYLFEFLRSLGLGSTWIEVFYTPPKQNGIIHSDNPDKTEWSKLYFQFGAKGSSMRWWDSDNVREVSTASGDGGDRTKRHYHGQVLIADEQDSSIIHEADLQSPHIVNVGQLHSSHNPTLEKRFVVTLALFHLNGHRLLWSDALKKFENYYDN